MLIGTSRLPKTALATVAVGLVAIILGSRGLWFNFNSLSVHYSVDDKLPYFYQAFYFMSGICLVCYLALIGCGFQFLRGQVSAVGLFIGILAFECVYFLGLGLTWAILSYHLSVGSSVAAATGVANGGLMYQFNILFPIWGSIAAYWAKRRLIEPAAGVDAKPHCSSMPFLRRLSGITIGDRICLTSITRSYWLIS